MGAACGMFVAGAMAGASDTYFTTSNMWYESPERIYSTHYRAGEMIPGGTEIEMIETRRGAVTFRIVGQDDTYKYTHVNRHSTAPAADKIAHVFSEQNRFEDVVRNSDPHTQDAIRTGEIIEGMTRQQVIAARGYPPSHVTQSHETDEIWTYWDRRTETRDVVFVNDEVYFGK